MGKMSNDEISDYLFQSLPGGYHRCAMDDGYSFLYVSDRFLNLLGWTKEELKEKFDNKFENLIHPEDKKLTHGYVDRILNNVQDNPYQEAMYRLLCRDGYHWFSDSTMKVTVDDDSFFQGFITDISPFIAEKQQKYELIASLGEVFEEVCQVDLRQKKYHVLSGQNEGKSGDFDDLKLFIQEKDFGKKEKNRLLKLMENSTIQNKLRNQDKFSWDFKTGKENWYTISAIAQKRDENGNVTQMLLAAQNVTEQKRKELEYQEKLEEETKELEKLLGMEKEYSAILPVLRNVYDQIFAIELETDTYYRIQSSSERETFAESSGKAKETFTKVMRSVVSDNYMQTLDKFIDFDTIAERLTDTDNIFTEYMDRKGNWKSLSFLVQERNESGKPVKVLFTIRNINKQKEAELEQQRREEIILRTMTEAIHGGFKLGKNDYDFTFIMVSEQLAWMLGYDSPEELMEVSGGCMTGIADNEIARSQWPQAWKSVQAGEMYTMHYPVRCKDGSWKNIEDRGRLIINEKGEEEYWSFIIDQDEMVKIAKALDATKKANKELSEARNELKIASDKANAASEAKSQFLFNMSHDIRTPMNAILGYNQLMKKKLTDPVLLDYQDKIERSGNLLLSIINNVLDMARIESGKLELDENYVYIPDVVNDIYNAFVREAEKKNITFSYDAQVQHQHIMCDITKMKEVFLNLTSNAIKYTPSGKTITVRTTELPCNEEEYAIVKTEVIDTGIGMSKEFLPRIFDSFEREKNTTAGKVSGTGLGMSIVKRLVDFMGGSIEVESELGKGSRFTVTFKHRIADKRYYEKAAELPHADGMKENIRGKRVLLAEDNDLNAEIADAVLSDAGMIVERIEDGVQCVAQIEKYPAGTYDLILMDIQMPNMDGYKATQAIRRLADKEKANIPIVAMTANAFEKDRQDAFAAGMNGHIAKPINIQNVEEVLISILNSEH